MGITVIPAYRVVARFAGQSAELPQEEGLDYLEQRVRGYVRNLLSMLQPSIMELGERSTVTQLGDPDQRKRSPPPRLLPPLVPVGLSVPVRANPRSRSTLLGETPA